MGWFMYTELNILLRHVMWNDKADATCVVCANWTECHLTGVSSATL